MNSTRLDASTALPPSTIGTAVATYPAVNYSYTITNKLSLEEVQRFRKQVAGTAHPCLSFFLLCYSGDPTTEAFYDGNHVYCLNSGFLFDEKTFITEPVSTANKLKDYGINHIILSFDKLTLDEIQILVRYFKQ